MNMLKCPACNKIMVEGIKRCPICNTDSRFFKSSNETITNEVIANDSSSSNFEKANFTKKNTGHTNNKSFDKDMAVGLIKKMVKISGSVLKIAIDIVIIIVVFSILFGGPNNKIRKAVDKFGEDLGISGSDDGTARTSVVVSEASYVLDSSDGTQTYVVYQVDNNSNQ